MRTGKSTSDALAFAKASTASYQSRSQAGFSKKQREEEARQQILDDPEAQSVIEDWWSLVSQSSDGARASSEEFVVMCKKVYKTIGNDEGQILHPESEGAKESARRDWERALKGSTGGALSKPALHPHAPTTAATVNLPTATAALPDHPSVDPTISIIPIGDPSLPTTTPYICRIRPCTHAHACAFQSAAELTRHMRASHKPTHAIPATALVPHVHRCRFCRTAISASATALATHISPCSMQDNRSRY